MKHIFPIFLLLLLFNVNASGPGHPSSAAIDAAREAWVNSLFDSMTEAERIGQLFMIRAHSNLGSDHVAKVEQLIKTYQVGGLCFFQGSPEKQAKLTNQYQKLSQKIPLMVSMDAEWGLGMRLKENAISFPYQLMLGAIQDNRLLYDMGKEVARQCRRLGVHINFAPVADVNNNPENPVINFRSFGEDR
ncbi:MAG: glycoside hydrolase family 3 N-terminal domain-containing protein, partial [Bacteroidota bacterium]